MRIFLGVAALPVAACLAAGIGNVPPIAKVAAPAAYPNDFIATPPVIDGKSDDWGTDSLKYDAGSHLQYAVLNDARTLYVRLRSADASTQAKMALLGMTTWLDSTGRNQQQFGIHFPLPIDLNTLQTKSDRPAGAMGPSAAERQQQHVARLRTVIADAHTIELLKFRGSKQPVLTDSDAPLGVKAAIGLDDKDNLIYELAVPLRLIYKRVPALANGQKANVGVWFVGDKLKPDPKAEPDQSLMTGSGMGGMYGGGMGRGYRGGPASTFQTFSLKTSTPLAGQ